VRVSRRGLADAADRAVAADGAVAAGAEPVVAAGAEPVVAEGAQPVVAEAATALPAASDEPVAHPAGTEITAPIIGVFFRRPAPDQPPFVEVGDDVAVGTTTAVVEVMKMMVPVEANVAGRIVAVLAEDGDLVDAGQPLFVVDTSVVT
jgi:acetyl-CoA carboxylase biotin carboxyl carrier protein